MRGRIRIHVLTAITVALAATSAAAATPAGTGATPRPRTTPRAIAAAGPRCNRPAARASIVQTKLGRRFVAFLHGDPWTISTLRCAPLMGGGQTDMVALGSCCTAASPTPLFIFRPAGRRWKLTYSSNLTALVDRLTRRGSTLIEKRPVYHLTTPLCCPAGFTYWSIRYRRHHWRVSRTS